MSKQTDSGSTDLPRKKLLAVAMVSLFTGLLIGAGLTAYKFNERKEAVSGSNQAIDYEQKIKTLEMTVAQEPENITAWVLLGHAYYDTDQYNKAIEAYEKSLVLDPGKPDILTDLGVMYRRSGNPGKAISSFDKAISIDQKHEAARFNKGIVLMNDFKERDKAVKTWEELLEINPIAMAGNNQSLDELIQHYKKGHDKDTP